jgi:hypothetical protein
MHEWKLPNGMTMTLDGVEHRFHVRERDNRVAIVISQPGWAAAQDHDYWYVHVEDLKSTGEISEGQEVKRWRYRCLAVHGGVSKVRALLVAQERYVVEATAQAPPAG